MAGATQCARLAEITGTIVCVAGGKNLTCVMRACINVTMCAELSMYSGVHAHSDTFSNTLSSLSTAMQCRVRVHCYLHGFLLAHGVDCPETA